MRTLTSRAEAIKTNYKSIFVLSQVYKNKYFWTVIALVAVFSIFYYSADIPAMSWLSLQGHFGITRRAFERALFLIPIVVAAWKFGFKAGLVCSIISGLIMTPRVIVSPWRADATTETMVIVIIGIMLSWLISSQEKERIRQQFLTTELDTINEKLEKQVTKHKRTEVELARHRNHLEELVNERATKLKIANEKLQRENAERKRAEEELKQAIVALERSNTELQQFAYVASHDLQEPLRMVSSFTQLLAKRYQGKLDKDADEFIDYAVAGAKRMQALINDLLAYSRVGTRGKPFEPIDSEATFDQAIANLRVAIEEGEAVITHDPLPPLIADDLQIVQLFQNLLGNAIKFHGKEPPRAHVSAKQENNEWVFSVRDNGIGIAPEYFDRIFVIFQRLHGREEYPGTGTGLAICKRIVERHGGRIWVESEPSKGSTFYFTIPTIRR